jgi:sec-independent protein translocase protein TatC
MPHVYNEDLFESTKMSFGEHLEELRVCLVKAVIGLAVGFLLGLLVAGPVVEMIKEPLQRALTKFYFEKTKAELESQYGTLSSDLEDFMRDQRFVFQNVYLELSEVERMVATAATAPAKRQPQSASAGAADAKLLVGGEPGAPTARLVKTRLWRPVDANVTSLSAHEPFMIWVKAAVITGAILASPWIFLQIWNFVAAGLYPHEKGHVYFFLPISLGLFFAGAALAFFFVFDPVLKFLFDFNRMMNIDPDPRISEWLSFVLLMPLGFGISFQLPLVMLIAERIGIVSIGTYLDKWRISVMVIFVVSMVLTPADPISMLLMGIPLTFLYFGGILLCKYAPRRTSPYGAGYDPQ